MKNPLLTTRNIIFWAPRLIGIVFILFLALFALDVFIPGKSVDYYATALVMHLIPNFVIAAVLLIAWWKEKIGGIAFILLYIVSIFFYKAELIGLILFSPLIIIGTLFLLQSRTEVRES